MVSGILWLGPVFDRGGYGAVSRNYVLGLARLGVPLRVVNTGEMHREIDPTDARRLAALADGDPGPAPALLVHAEPTAFAGFTSLLPTAARRIGITIFETDRVPEAWVAPCNAMDEVWVPSRFNRETFTQAGVSAAKLRVVPYGVDTTVLDPSRPIAPHRFEPWVKSFRFLYAFAYDYRKGVDLLLRAFLREFGSDEDVALVLKTYLPGHFAPADGRRPAGVAEELLRAVPELAREDTPQVILLEGPIAQDDMLSLYAAADAYVSTDRANGWGMPCLEMMALGKPAATIDWSGSTEFMHERNSFLIRPTGALVPVDERLQRARPLYLGHRWAEVSVGEVQRVLRAIHADPARRALVGAAARRDVLARHTCERVAAQVAEALGCPQREQRLRGGA